MAYSATPYEYKHDAGLCAFDSFASRTSHVDRRDARSRDQSARDALRASAVRAAGERGSRSKLTFIILFRARRLP